MRATRGARGYTVVEVMSAMTLFAIGAAGVISMQRVTIQGGEDARRMDVGANLANQWSFRLSRDAAFWTQPSGSTTDFNNIGNTRWLSNAPGSAGAATAWLRPDPSVDVGQGGFDLWGRDRVTAGEALFCAQYRLSWITFVGAAPPYLTTALLKTEVRVIWKRLELTTIGSCASVPTTDALDDTIYHWVNVNSAVRPTPQQ